MISHVPHRSLNPIHIILLSILLLMAIAPDQLRVKNNEVDIQAYPIDQRSYLHLPRGSPHNLPSVTIEANPQTFKMRGMYGGNGDKKHLGGFVKIDMYTISPKVWKDMVNYFGVKSIMDVGCGRGISTSWFVFHGVESLCIEGSHDATSQTMLPDPALQIVEHDFSRGPWWPAEGKTYDAVWSVEFLEHVGRNFHQNYIPLFRKAALIFVTHSDKEGWHHVEVHDDTWWISKMQLYGFVYSEELTRRVRNLATEEKNQQIKTFSPTGQPFNARYVEKTMLVFLNPLVGSLPQHSHLFAEDGCSDGVNRSRPCAVHPKSEETSLPSEFQRLVITEEMEEKWSSHVREHLA